MLSCLFCFFFVYSLCFFVSVSLVFLLSFVLCLVCLFSLCVCVSILLLLLSFCIFTVCLVFFFFFPFYLFFLFSLATVVACGLLAPQRESDLCTSVVGALSPGRCTARESGVHRILIHMCYPGSVYFNTKPSLHPTAYRLQCL